MLLRNEMKIQDDFSVLTRNAAPGSISAMLRVVWRGCCGWFAVLRAAAAMYTDRLKDRILYS